jgi:hypothetical protein
MVTRITRRSLSKLIVLPIASLVFPALAQNVAPNMTGVPRLAIGGYDTVAYHTVGKAVPGTLDYQTIWHDARWQFASRENLDLFTRDPEKYAAQYDGHRRRLVRQGIPRSGHDARRHRPPRSPRPIMRHRTSQFDILLEVGPNRFERFRVMIALEYLPDDRELRVITLC